ncbi:MAG: hypothetical protein AB2693_19395 [Candidatus Thiodiazotropha sp.]
MYTTHPQNIAQCFTSSISLSDHFPIGFTRKVSSKISKDKHITTTYRSFKRFDENAFIYDITNDLNTFEADKYSIDEDLSVWYSLILKHLNNHAPIKSKRVKNKRMPDWFTPDISQMQSLRDKSKRLKQWNEYRRYRNKTKQLIRHAKRKYFSNCISNSKDSKTIWRHLRSVSNGTKVASNSLPEELIFENERITDSKNIAHKLNTYFASVAEILNEHNSTGNTCDLNVNKITHFIYGKVPKDIQFTIPFKTPE